MLCHPTLFKQLVSSAVLSWIVQVYPDKGLNWAETSQVVLWVCIYIWSFFFEYITIFSCNTVTNSARNFRQETQLLESHNRIYIHTYIHTGFLSAFCPRGAKWDCMDYWGGKYVSVCKACGKLGGSGGMLPREIFDFGPFIRHNLVESGAVFTQT